MTHRNIKKHEKLLTFNFTPFYPTFPTHFCDEFRIVGHG